MKKPPTTTTTEPCQGSGIACNGTDVRRVHLVLSNRPFRGGITWTSTTTPRCAGCRERMNGAFKYAR